MSVKLVQNVAMAPGQPLRPVSDSAPVSQPSQPPASAPVADADPIGKAEAAINQALQNLNTHVSITHDKATNRYVFMRVDMATGAVVNQYPTEDMLRQIARVRQLTGLAVDTGS